MAVQPVRDRISWGQRWRRATASARALPDYLILGAQRSGTTSLYTYLTDHPWIVGTAFKEIHFFDLHWPRGVGWYRSRFPTRWRLNRLAREAGCRTLVGEATPDYLYYPFVAQRLAQVAPEARCLVLLRNPVERAHSHYHHSRRLGFEPLSFEEALAAETDRLRAQPAEAQADSPELLISPAHHSYLSRGHYADRLERLFEHLPREQVLVLSAEALFRHTAVAVAHACAFLEVPFQARSLYPVHNLSGGRYEPMAPALRRDLEAYFAPHNQRLTALLGIDFGWTPSDQVRLGMAGGD